jgi:hypothetical protein
VIPLVGTGAGTGLAASNYPLPGGSGGATPTYSVGMLLRVVVVLVVIGVTVYALVDCWGSDGPSVRLLPRPLWFLVVLVPVVGPVLWLVAGRPRELPAAPAARPLAPDDDPEFLRRLDMERRRRAAEEERRRRRERQDGNGPEGEDRSQGSPA